MADEEAPAPRQKPSLDRSMSTKAAFAKAFVSAHAVPTFDQPMLIYHGGGIAMCLLFALLLPLMRLDSDKGFLAGVVWALCFLFGAFFYIYLLLNPPERVELYTNRIVVRLHREGKFLIPMKDVADVQICENPFKTYCQPVAMHIRATQIKSCVYIQSKYKVSPMGMVLTVEDSEEFVASLKKILNSDTATDNPTSGDDAGDAEPAAGAEGDGGGDEET